MGVFLHVLYILYGKCDTYVFTRICFGNKPSPTIAELSMIKMAQVGKETHPLASNMLLKNRYVDDIIESSSFENKLTEAKHQVDELIGRFGFNIKNWYCNNSNIGTKVDKTKLLGLIWNINEDKLRANLGREKITKLTKRRMLTTIAQIWDPLGLLGGIVLTGKLLFQSVVRVKAGWDDNLEDKRELMEKWKNWVDEVEKCDDVVVSRCILPDPDKFKEGSIKGEIIGFSDGSSSAYGCVLYMRWSNSDESNIDVKFLGAKTKVAPIGGNSVPRNELCGALILARLNYSLMKSLGKTEMATEYLREENTKLNVDSTTVLSWVRSPAINYKPFVKNKVIEIQNLSSSYSWKYIPSEKNKAADLLSKGCKREELDIIIHGPNILKVPSQDWPVTQIKTTDEDLESVHNVGTNIVEDSDPIIDPHRFSSWRKSRD